LIITPNLPENSEAEIRAFETTCERLAGFDGEISAEWLDGALCALAAGPVRLEPAVWLPVLLGDTWARVFADPADEAQALQALLARLRVLHAQLDPEALFEQPEQMRLNPWMAEWTDDERQKLVEAGELDAEQAAVLQTGALWAEGFFKVVEDLPQLWTLPAADDAAELFNAAFDQIAALMIPNHLPEWQQHLEKYYPEPPLPSRDDLIAEAVMSVQDLRMYWVDFAPRPETRRVEAAPGRNDPCPCGSGKKFKKCHGAAA
jgi:uncharacterized protein